MRKRKKTVRSFAYRDCDAMAQYLEEMAGKGWHFTGWSMGLRFERGEPAKVHYTVEAFPKGSESQCRPSEDTEEYAEYCREAGWELVDGWQKFCVFRQIKEDADPIVTPDERYQNIMKADRNRCLWNIIGRGVVFFLIWQTMFRNRPAMYIFTDIWIVLMVIIAGELLWSLLGGIQSAVWGIRQRRNLKANGEISAGRYRKKERIMSQIPFIGFCISIGLILAAAVRFQSNMSYMLWMVVILLIAGGLMYAFYSIVRPSSGENWMFQIGLVFCILIIMVTMLLLPSGGERSKEEILGDAPLLLEDYKDVASAVDTISEESFKGMAGSAKMYSIDYRTAEGSEDLDYCMYTSPYPWILDIIFRQEKGYGESRELPAEGLGIQRAVADEGGFHTYRLLGSEHLLVLYNLEEPLDDRQLQSICEKLTGLEAEMKKTDMKKTDMKKTDMKKTDM